jgi:ATP-binding cassette subfamily B protein
MNTRGAFSRAWRFLNFKPVAKWSAIAAAVSTGLLYVLLLLILGLFVDLLVSRGQLSEHVDAEWVAALLQEEVGDEAADLFHRSRTDPESVRSLGILGLVARSTNYPLIHHTAAWLARTNPWMWDTGDAVPYLTGLLVLAVVVAMLRTLLFLVMHYAAAVTTIEAATRMRRAIYHHTFRLGALAIRALGPSEAASNFTRHVESIHDALYTWLTVLLREAVQFGLLLAFALFINFWLAVAFLVFALLVWLGGGRMVAYYRDQGLHATHESAGRLSLLQESLMMLRLVKCYLMELFNQARVERQLKLYSRSQLERLTGEASAPPLLVFLGLLASVVLLYVVGLLVLRRDLAVGGAIILVTALVSLYLPLVQFLENLRIVRRGRESAAILFEFLDRPGEVGQAVGAEFLPPLASRLEFLDVNLKEPGTNRVLLRGVHLSVKAGQCVALVGPDELEKHALVYLIPRFLDPTSGEVRIDHHNLRWVTFDSLRTQIAVVLQHNLVFNDTVATNIGCGDKAFTLPQIIEAAKVAHAHHFIQKLPKGYDTPVGEMAHALSTSQKFRVALARAILRDPALLIIEEPPAGSLDDDAKSLLDDTFNRLLPGRTAIFLPHRIATLNLCNQVLLLHKGKIEAAGTHRELLEQSELYRHLHYLEFNMFAGEY